MEVPEITSFFAEIRKSRNTMYLGNGPYASVSSMYVLIFPPGHMFSRERQLGYTLCYLVDLCGLQ